MSEFYQSVTGGSKHSAKKSLVESVLIIVAAVVIAYFIGYYTYVVRVFPPAFDLPVYAVITFVAGYVIIRIVSAIIWRITSPKLGVTRGQGAKNFFEIVAVVILVAIVFGIFGFNLTNWLIGAGFLGIVLGLAAQQVLGNIFAGIAMLFSRPFDIGDRITLVSPAYGVMGPTYNHETIYPGYTGIVKDIGIFYTRLSQDEGVPTVWPNSVVINSLVLNHTRVSERTVRVRIDLDRGIDYKDFKNELQTSLETRGKDAVLLGKTSVEIVDVATSTYQVVITVWSKSTLEEPVKTVVIQSAMDAQNSLVKRKGA